jgi:hypothetical protein
MRTLNPCERIESAVENLGRFPEEFLTRDLSAEMVSRAGGREIVGHFYTSKGRIRVENPAVE